jgi:hypothetical protein
MAKAKMSFVKRQSWYVLIGCSLLVVSGVAYCVQIIIFHRTEDTFFYMLQDFAFVPIQVLLVTLILNELLRRREKRALLGKMNMAIGVFFSEVGTGLLRSFAALDPQVEVLRSDLMLSNAWSRREFAKMRRRYRTYAGETDVHKSDLGRLKAFLLGKRDFMLNLLQNPNLLEHESFTDLLWAVFHLAEELVQRKNFKGLPDTDYQHLAGDMKRVYMLLISEWLAYMEHLKQKYPYLFSLAIRMNPFDPDASPEVR